MGQVELELASLEPKELDFLILLAYKSMNKYLEQAFLGPFDWEKWESDLRRTIFNQINIQNNDNNHGFERVFLIKLIHISDPIGFVWFSLHSEGIFWIDTIILDEDYRGKGYGSQIFSLLVTKAKELDLSSIDLGVQEANDKAIVFYKKLGFQEVTDISLAYYKTKRMRFDLITTESEIVEAEKPESN